jgi:anti-anti-sigma regulatory factor
MDLCPPPVPRRPCVSALDKEDGRHVGIASRRLRRVEHGSGGGSLARHAIAGIVPGDHVCASYGSDDEHQAIVAGCARQALRRNERFLYLADRSDDDTIRAYLAEDGIDLDAGRALGQIRIRRLEHGPARIDPEAMIAALQADRVAARCDGYSALCGTAEMSWTLTRPAQTDAVVQYEREISRVFKTADVAGLCQYDRRLFAPDVLERLVATHEFHVCICPERTTTARRHLTICEGEDGAVALAGALDIDASVYLAARLAALDDSDEDLVVRTCDLDFTDISGCRVLVRAAEGLAPGRRLVLADASAQLMRVLKLCGWWPHGRLVVG